MYWKGQGQIWTNLRYDPTHTHTHTHTIYILVDASGWVVSDVSFGFMGGFGSFNIRPPHPNDPVGIDLTPTLIPAANLRIHTKRKKKMTTEKALYIILLQPIRAKLYWWLLNLSFKNREATLLCFFATMGSLFGYLFIPVCISSFFSPF